MKRTMTLLLALALLLALLVGCSGGTTAAPSTEPSAAPTAAPTAAPSAAPTAAPTAEPVSDSPYRFASGVELDAKGIPTARYDYQLPLSTTDEILTYWCTGASGLNDIVDDFANLYVNKKMQELTGVTVEYQVVSSESAKNNLAVMLASDALPDMISKAKTYFSVSLTNLVEDDYIVNLYDYQEYCPNYIYLINSLDRAAHDTAYVESDLIPQFFQVWNAFSSDRGWMTRGDWLDKLGMKAEDVVTYDDFYTMLSRMKSELNVKWPLLLLSTGDCYGSNFGAGYDTIGGCNLGSSINATRLVRDGEVFFSYDQEGTYKYLEMVSKWYKEGLIDPDFMSYKGISDLDNGMVTGDSGVVFSGTDRVKTYKNQNADKDARMVALSMPLAEKGQQLHIGGSGQWLSGAGNTAISTRCANIPLAVTWCDYTYSPAAFDLWNYGEEGVAYSRNADGEIRWTEAVTNNPQNLSFQAALYFYAWNLQLGVTDRFRDYYTDSAAEQVAIADYWNATNNNDNLYSYPSGITLDSAQNDAFAKAFTDLSTYIVENYFAFYVGDKPLSEWDAYVKYLDEAGMGDAIAIWQEAYDEYISAE